MIHNKVDASGNVELKVGDRATLMLLGAYKGFFFDHDLRDAHYLGYIPPNEEFHGPWSDGWGHLFASVDTSWNISLHLAQSLKMQYWSDGDDEPSYAVGISASNTHFLILNNLERQFLIERFKKWNS
jgi:hypothetical protein